MPSSDIVENIHIRMREEIESQGLSMADAARNMGEKNAQRLRDIVNGRQKLSAEMLAKSAVIGIDVNYVLTGDRDREREYFHAGSPGVDFSVQDAAQHYEQPPGLSALGNQQRDLVTQLISALSEKPQPGFSAEAVRKMVMTVQEIMLEERMQLTPEEVADAVINCLQQAARPDRDGVSRQLHVVK